MARSWVFSAIVLGGFSWACTSAGNSGQSQSVIRDTLPNGAVHLLYDGLPLGEPLVATQNLRIGTLEGDPDFAFGDIRGIESGPNGEIFVLDYHGPEIRAFDRDGHFVELLASKGSGPGELSEANGMMIVGDSILWVQDHSKWAMIGLSLTGEELARFPMHVRSYGYIWSGMIDNVGRLWKPTSHSDDVREFPPREGVAEGTSRSYWKSYDLSSEVVDSVFLGESRYRTYISRTSSGGYSYRSIPFDPSPIVAVDPDGGFWQVDNSDYQVARLNESGDTVLLIGSAVDPLSVSEDDKVQYIDQVLERSPDQRRAAEEIADLMAPFKPVINDLVVDPAGRLWIGRQVPEGQTPVFDVFGREGDYKGSVRLGFHPSPYLSIRIRHGSIFAVELDEFDVPFVVRAEIPDALKY